MSDPIWKPSSARIKNSKMLSFQRFLAEKVGINLTNYDDLHEFSVNNVEQFWQTLSEFVEIRWADKPSTVLSWTPSKPMRQARWFPGAKLNFAENLLSGCSLDKSILCFVREGGSGREELSLKDLKYRASALAAWMVRRGVKKGDHVAGVVSNSLEAVIAMLATSWVGAVWSSCSPDFGVSGIIDRLAQVQPRVLFFATGYYYNGKFFDCCSKIEDCRDKLKETQYFVGVSPGNHVEVPWVTPFENTIEEGGLLEVPDFAACDFDDPLYIMFSSGTTGRPKCIVHGVGGTLLQHFKELSLHSDLGEGDSLLFFTTCGWMMWNWMVSAIGVGTRVVLYDGSPSFPDLSTLWRIVEKEKVTVFGTSPKFLGACIKEGISPIKYGLAALKGVLSTGAPLLPEHMDWLYSEVKEDILVSSISGGTDILSCFMLGNPLLPVYRGEIQCIGLGMAVESWDEEGNSQKGVKGELVCTKPFVSMPIGFLGDPDGEKFSEAYFDFYPDKDVWRHGDFIEITSNGGVVVYGRSDTTLNPGGVRIGTAEIYRQVEVLPAITDSLVIGKSSDGDVEIWLFVKLAESEELTEALAKLIRSQIRSQLTPRHLPKRIFEVSKIPYTRSGKKVEIAVLNAVDGRKITNLNALVDPEAMEEYEKIRSNYQSLSF